VLALWCRGNAAVWGCHHSLCSSKGIGQAGPTTFIPKNVPQKTGCGPYLKGHLCPFAVSGAGLTCCLPQG